MNEKTESLRTESSALIKKAYSPFWSARDEHRENARKLRRGSTKIPAASRPRAQFDVSHFATLCDFPEDARIIVFFYSPVLVGSFLPACALSRRLSSSSFSHSIWCL